MKETIIKISKAVNISDIGFCRVCDYEKSAERILQGNLSKKNKKAEDIVKGAKTIIVCTFNYFNGRERGNISRYAQGKDYHIVAIEKMQSIADYLHSCGYKAEAFSDTGYLNERILAKESGVAFIGRNQMAISEKFGSYFFIGYILTDCEMDADAKNTNCCIGCNKCVDICPLGALGESFLESKCLSYITQKKGELTKVEEEALRKANTIWGCDLCQEVCPHNKNAPITEIDEFKTNLIINLNLEDMSNKEFKEKYGTRAFSWRGKGVLIRNHKILEKK